jgi:hypothetical protein
VNKVETFENEYLIIINTYVTCDIQRLCEMLSTMVVLLKGESADVRGQLYKRGYLSTCRKQGVSPSAAIE